MTPRACRGCGSIVTKPSPYCDGCEFMTPEQVQAKLHWSKSTYFRRVAEGIIRPRRAGGRKLLVSRVEIDNLLSP